MDNQNQPEKVVKRSKAELKAQAQAEVQKNKTVDMVKIMW